MASPGNGRHNRCRLRQENGSHSREFCDNPMIFSWAVLRYFTLENFGNWPAIAGFVFRFFQLHRRLVSWWGAFKLAVASLSKTTPAAAVLAALSALAPSAALFPAATIAPCALVLMPLLVIATPAWLSSSELPVPAQTSTSGQCSLWVKSRHRRQFERCPLYLQKRTSELRLIALPTSDGGSTAPAAWRYWPRSAAPNCRAGCDDATQTKCQSGTRLQITD